MDTNWAVIAPYATDNFRSRLSIFHFPSISFCWTKLKTLKIGLWIFVLYTHKCSATMSKTIVLSISFNQKWCKTALWLEQFHTHFQEYLCDSCFCCTQSYLELRKKLQPHGPNNRGKYPSKANRNEVIPNNWTHKK